MPEHRISFFHFVFCLLFLAELVILIPSVWCFFFLHLVFSFSRATSGARRQDFSFPVLRSEHEGGEGRVFFLTIAPPEFALLYSVVGG